MKLIQSIGPNPHVVKLFIAEKGLDIERQDIDIMKGENRQAEFLAINPAGQSPALVLDDASVITEITAICEYLDEVHPEPSLMGSTPEERAQTRMWVRRIDHGYLEPMANGFRYSEGLPLFESRFKCIPEAADGLKTKAAEYLGWLDEQLGEGPWICGERYTLADVLLFAFMAFAGTVGQPHSGDLSNVNSWFERIQARDAVKATA